MQHFSTCPVCNSIPSPAFLRRDNVPVFQSIMVANVNHGLTIEELGNISMRYCQVCGFIFNDGFEQSKVVYNEQYDTTQGYSSYFNSHMDTSVEYLLNNHHISNAIIVEVGCGKGDFLKKLISKEPSNKGIGFDTTYTGEESF
jgi:Zn-finger nucleic acid-binding protein